MKKFSLYSLLLSLLIIMAGCSNEDEVTQGQDSTAPEGNGPSSEATVSLLDVFDIDEQVPIIKHSYREWKDEISPSNKNYGYIQNGQFVINRDMEEDLDYDDLDKYEESEVVDAIEAGFDIARSGEFRLNGSTYTEYEPLVQDVTVFKQSQNENQHQLQIPMQKAEFASLKDAPLDMTEAQADEFISDDDDFSLIGNKTSGETYSVLAQNQDVEADGKLYYLVTSLLTDPEAFLEDTTQSERADELETYTSVNTTEYNNWIVLRDQTGANIDGNVLMIYKTDAVIDALGLDNDPFVQLSDEEDNDKDYVYTVE